MMEILNTVYLVAVLVMLVIVLPWLTLRELARFRRLDPAEVSAARLHSYRQTIMHEWILMLVLLGGWLLLGRSVTSLGPSLTIGGWQWVAVAVSVLATAGFAVMTWRTTSRESDLREVRAQLGDLELYSPHTRQELRLFGWVSVTAGVCEEIIYRGVLMSMLAGLMGLWPAVVVSSVIFGLAHAYQGAMGIVRTGLVGVVMALVVVFTGSLPLAMAIHAVIDLVQGRMLWAAVNTNAPGESAGPTVQTEMA
jgi:membrane protease YdiL (CAAX protease family)